jgi:hypothetical protein
VKGPPKRWRIASILVQFVLPVGLAPLFPRAADAFTAEEHYDLANGIWQEVLGEIGAIQLENETHFSTGDGFLAIPRDLHEKGDWSHAVRAFALPDADPTRFHRQLESTQRQLSRIQASDLQTLLQERVVAGEPPARPAAEARLGAVANFFLHHWIAMQLAIRAADIDFPNDPSKTMRSALLYEAMAQGYLVDAFSASHMLLPDPNWLSWLHSRNTKLVHDDLRASGTFVIDSRHRVWLSYGDGLLFWYPLALERVREATRDSLREVLACFYKGFDPENAPSSLREWLNGQYPAGNCWETVDAWLAPRDAITYYAELRMPSLLSIPMPIAATWSVRAEEEIQPAGVEPKIYARLHYPQLAEARFHDPSLTEADLRDLYSRDEVPDWMVFPALGDHSPEALIETAPDVASVRWQCERHPRPSFLGGLTSAGIGNRIHPKSDEWVGSIGIGYGLLDEEFALPWVPNIKRLSMETRWDAGLDRAGDALTGVAALQLWCPTRADLHVDLGYAVATREPLHRHGPTIGLGLTLDTFELPLTHMASLIRVRWELLYLDEITGGPVLEFVVH